MSLALKLIHCFTVVLILVGCESQLRITQSNLANITNGQVETISLSSVAISSDGSNSAYAKTGDTISVVFSASGSLDSESVSVLGQSATITILGGGAYRADYTLMGTEIEGIVSFNINAANMAAPITNTTDASSVIYDRTPGPAPSSVSLNSPAFVHYNTIPVLTVSGVESGATVEVFSDSGCSSLLGSGVATGTSINITMTGLADGAYDFYARQTDPSGNASTCSIATTAYRLQSRPMISTWQTTTPGETITLPLRSGFNYNMIVHWGDGSTSDVTSFGDTDKIHTFASSGVQTIMIFGTAEAWYFNGGGDKDKILTVSELGDMGWTNFNSAFRDCDNLTTVSGGVTSNVTDMGSMFRQSINVNPDMSSYDTSNVTNMSFMFYLSIAATATTTGSWDTSSVTNMTSMFRGATNAAPNTSSWDTSNVLTMDYMFSGATSANPVTTNWNTSNVTTMYNMFNGAINAIPDTSLWDVGSVTTMFNMFAGATNANPDTSSWDTSNVTSMVSMFRDATSANPDTSSWDTSNVTSMDSMFEGATNANPDTSSWITTNVTNMKEMFYNATSANPATSSWNTSNVTDMDSMFRGATSANPDTSSWNTSNVTGMQSMFRGATSAHPDTSAWVTSSVTNIQSMFREMSADPVLSSWDVSNVLDMQLMFYLNSVATASTVGSWDTSSVTNMRWMFASATSAAPDMSAWDFGNVTNMENMFGGGVILPTANYSNMLNRINATSAQSGVTLSGGDSLYSTGAAAARANLISNGWTISDGGPE
ncbi:MAG: DUF285 domain-containing protein [Bacteriovoracaceae bacterium]|nr:DUF285 domain-containing protein [Bacteriovoracaceae bacterium]